MRYVIWGLNDYFRTPRRVDMDGYVVEFGDEAPLVWGDRFDAPQNYGKAINLEFANGEITGELWCYDDKDKEHIETLLEHKHIVLGGYYTDLVMNESGDVVLHCRLRAVSMVPEASIPMRFADNPKGNRC